MAQGFVDGRRSDDRRLRQCTFGPTRRPRFYPPRDCRNRICNYDRDVVADELIQTTEHTEEDKNQTRWKKPHRRVLAVSWLPRLAFVPLCVLCG